MERIDLSISVVSYNTKGFVKNCLNSIYQYTRGIKFEVILVDNGSTDGSIEMFKREFPQVKLIENGENLGFARANNQAFNRSKGRFFLLLNSDTKVLPHSIERMVEFMDLHSDVGAVGCKQIHPDGSIQPTLTIALNMWTNLWLIFLRLFQLRRVVSNSRQANFMVNYLGRILGRTVSSYLKHYSDDKRMPYEVDWVSGTCLLVRRDTINEVGLLDENFFMYTEDVDWCLRMKRKGWKIYFLPGNKVIHYVRQSSKGEFGNFSPQRFKSIYYFFNKYHGRKAVILLKILVVLSMFIQIELLLIPYFLSPGKKEAVKARLKQRFNLIKFSMFLQ